MGVAHVGLVHRDLCECKVKGFRAVSSIERNVSNRRHLQGVRQTVSNFSACTCRGFRYMCTSALGNPTKKWILCKHLYFILQNCMFCTVDDVFIHCPGWTTNEVRLLMSRMESRK